MRYCLDCRRFVPRDAIFCPGCGGAVGGTRCVNGHTTPSLRSATFCPICRSRQLIEPAQTVGMGCASRLIGWTVALLLLKWSFANIGGILAFLWRAVVFIVGCTVVSWLFGLIKLLLAVRIMVWFISLGSEDLARQVNPFPKLIPFVLRTTGRALLLLLRGLLYVVEGRTLPAPKKSRKKENTED